LIPDPEDLLALEPEELAGVVLQHLNSLPPANQARINRHNFSLPHTVEQYHPDYQDRISEALMEAWVWLEREGLLAPRPGTQGEWVFITRRGKKLTKPADLEAYRNSNRLPKKLLHPRLAQKVWASFLRGDYDTAIFQAFKEVEVQVRKAGGFSTTDIGVPLMRKAFEPEIGPLSNHSVPKSEQEALSHLFSGAIGSYKNPSSHRIVTIAPEEATEIIVLASHLLSIVDKRASET
jgi:uncharacterized protein (TIGR02391 family)